MLYAFIKSIVSLGVNYYYKEIQIVNKEVLDELEGPAIIIANHPNTLMDAWMVGYANKRRVHFMAKATFFNTKFKRKVLSVLGLIPVNRKSDGAVKGVNNKDSFSACYELLESGGVLGVFPEGTSFLERKLRELKSGTARIALEAESRKKGALKIKVIPIGLNYISADSYRGKVLIHVGKPIQIGDLWKEYEQNQGIAAKKLTEKFRVELSRVFVNMSDKARENTIEKLRYLFVTKYTIKNKVDHEMEFMKLVQERMDEYSATSPWKVEQIEHKTDELIASLQTLNIKADFLDRPYRSGLFFRQVIQSWLFILLTVPLFLYGFIHHFIPYALIGWLIPKLTKDVEYHAPLAILLGLVLYPLNYIGFFFISLTFFQLDWLQLALYIVTLPIFGMFAHFYMRFIKHLNSKLIFNRFAKKRKSNFIALKENREALRRIIFES